MAETHATTPKTLKVFISYSRKDMAFADRLEAALIARGVGCLIDRTEIYAFEDWWKRIQALIVQADTIIFALSPDAVASDVCRKEVAFAAALKKRFAPVVVRRVDGAAVPKELAQLNFVFFDDDAKFDESVVRLSDALATNIAWVRRHTEFGASARAWDVARRPNGLLLRSPSLEDAEQWNASRPHGAPEPTAETRLYITLSRQLTTRRRNILTGSLAAGLILALVLGSYAYWQRGVAAEQRDAAIIQKGIAVKNELLAGEQRDQALRTQSRFLSDLAMQQVSAASTDAGTALLLSLAALPDKILGPDGNDLSNRPYLGEAERSLFAAHGTNHEIGIFTGHTSGVSSAAFSTDGTRIVTASGDNTARVWDAVTGKALIVLEGHKGAVSSAAFSSNGTRIVTASGDRTARVWDVATGAVIAVNGTLNLTRVCRRRQLELDPPAPCGIVPARGNDAA